MGIPVINNYSQKFSIKNGLPYLHGVFLVPVWLFPPSDAVLVISFTLTVSTPNERTQHCTTLHFHTELG